MEEHEIRVEKIPESDRLDKFLAAQTSFSRSAIRGLIEKGAVYVNDKRCRIASRTLRVGDSIRIFVSQAAPAAAEERAPYVLTADAIIFEDADLIVVHKPPYLPTHATIDDARHHLVLAVQRFLATRDGVDPAQVYLGLHHRLDRDTSGVILFTKRKEANAPIAQAFQDRKVQKEYLAAVIGEPKEEKFTVKSYLGRHPRNKRLFASVRRDGKYAETVITVLAKKRWQGLPVTLVKAEPLTGRTHQIRVHLSERGLPILGDLTYGGKQSGIPRLLLHAWKLRIGDQEWRAPLPEEFLHLDFRTPEE